MNGLNKKIIHYTCIWYKTKCLSMKSVEKRVPNKTGSLPPNWSKGTCKFICAETTVMYNYNNYR